VTWASGAAAGPVLGQMLSDAGAYMTIAPWLSVFPGLALAATVAGVELLGDGLARLAWTRRDATGWREAAASGLECGRTIATMPRISPSEESGLEARPTTMNLPPNVASSTARARRTAGCRPDPTSRHDRGSAAGVFDAGVALESGEIARSPNGATTGDSAP